MTKASHGGNNGLLGTLTDTLTFPHVKQECISLLVPMDDTPLSFIISRFTALRYLLDSWVQNGKGQCSEALSGIYGMLVKNVFFSEKSYHIKKKKKGKEC